MNRHELLATYRPLDEDGAMQRRVHLALVRKRSHRTAWGARVLRPALAFAMLALMTSLAAAWVARTLHARTLASNIASEHERSVATPRHSAPARPDAVVDTIEQQRVAEVAVHHATTTAHKHLARAVQTPEPIAETVTSGSTPAVTTAPIATEDVKTIVDTPVPMPAAPSAAEAKLIMDGLGALRVAHDSERAQESFARYLDRYPRGALVEEALAYEIEAAAARGSNAGALATEYLRRFPRGRFRVVAGNAQKRFAH